jgi:NHLM bacteriocin system ABC transporter ATP-binding protein
MPDFIKAQSEQIAVSGNSLLLLNRPDRIYLAAAENLDVFVVPLHLGRPRGVRQFLFRAQRDDLLFGLNLENNDTGLGLIVSGKPGSMVLEAPRSLIGQASLNEDPEVREQVRQLVLGWTEKLTLALDKGISPKDTELLSAGICNLQPGRSARPVQGERQLWIRHTDGTSLVFSDYRWTVSAADGYLPLSEYEWISARDEVTLECLSPEQYQNLDPGYAVLEDFHRSFLRTIRAQQRDSEREEASRLDEMIQEDQRRLSTTLYRLGESMETRERTILKELAPGDELLAACIRVGEEEGIMVRNPAEATRINTDPLLAIAKESNFRIRQVSLKGKWWKSDGGSMLGYLVDPSSEERHPVALLQVSPGSYVIEDPRTGSQRRIDKTSNEELDYFAYLFYRPFPNKPMKIMDLLQFGFFKLRKDQAMVILMSLAAALLGLLPPIANGIIFDTIVPEADRYGLLYLGAILISAAVATGLFKVTKIYSTMRLTGKTDLRVQSGVMDRLLSLPPSFFRDFTAGDLADRAMGINAIREILSGATLNSLMGGIFSVFSLALLFYYSWQLALVAMGITLFSVIVTVAIAYLQIRHQRHIQDIQGKLSGMVLQLISGISKLRVSGTEDRAFATWAETFSLMRKHSFKAARISNHLHAFTQALPGLGLLIIFGWITTNPLSGSSMLQTMSVGNIVAFNSAFSQFQMSFIQMAMTMISTLQVIPLYQRAKPILQAIPEVDSAKAGPGELSGDIEINKVYFRYDPEGPVILKNISLQIKPGEFAAIVGGSGSGKSTLLRLLLGFEKTESGSIYYDSQDLTTLDVTAVRRQLGVVLQNGIVMAGDVFSNIVGSSNLTMDDAWDAARMAGLDKDIVEMPMGMNTMVSPGGGTLSGGQRQRMLIARAIVNKPRIIYFDEATSALDNATQRIVSQSLEKLNATRVVIAHRLSTIQKADKIFVLDKGELVQQGTFRQLMKQPGLFAELAKRQIL